MAFVVLQIPFQSSEADSASVVRNFAGTPQPGDPVYMSGGLTVAEHIAGDKSSGIPAADVNELDARVVNIYDSYANALAYGETGLLDDDRIQGVNLLTGAADGVDTVQQSPAHANGVSGPKIGSEGNLDVAIEDDGAALTVYLMSGGGRQSVPTAVIVTPA